MAVRFVCSQLGLTARKEGWSGVETRAVSMGPKKVDLARTHVRSEKFAVLCC